VSQDLYNDAGTAFKEKGAAVKINSSVRSGGVMTIKYGENTLIIPENKNFVLLNNEKVTTGSINVLQNDTFYVNKSVLDLLPAGIAYDSKTITRAGFTAIVMDLLGSDSDSDVIAEPFFDVPESSPYYGRVMRARALGIVSGVGNNRFLPEAEISLQDVLVIIYNALDKTGRRPEFQIDQWMEFDDWDLVAEYAQNQIQTLVKMCVPGGVTSGGLLNPGEVVSRADAVHLAESYLFPAAR